MRLNWTSAQSSTPTRSRSCRCRERCNNWATTISSCWIGCPNWSNTRAKPTPWGGDWLPPRSGSPRWRPWRIPTHSSWRNSKWRSMSEMPPSPSCRRRTRNSSTTSKRRKTERWPWSSRSKNSRVRRSSTWRRTNTSSENSPTPKPVWEARRCLSPWTRATSTPSTWTPISRDRSLYPYFPPRRWDRTSVKWWTTSIKCKSLNLIHNNNTIGLKWMKTTKKNWKSNNRESSNWNTK